MNDKIEPALTPDEWKQWHEGERYIMPAEDSKHAGMMLNRRAFEIETRPFAVMALHNASLPDDDPRKITRKDVIELLVVSDHLDLHPDWSKALESIAAKLDALLPPVGA